MADGTFDKDLDMLMKLALLNGILDKDKKEVIYGNKRHKLFSGSS